MLGRLSHPHPYPHPDAQQHAHLYPHPHSHPHVGSAGGAGLATGGNRLNWSAVLGATSYRVYRHTSTPVPLDAGHRVVTILGGATTWYLDRRGQSGNYYVVTAANGYGESGPSNTARATQPCGAKMAGAGVGKARLEGGSEVVVTRYYYLNGQRIALWRGDVLQYLVGDHLGTTSLVLGITGNRVAESRHYPYGQVRWSWVDGGGTFPTDYRFTGQRLDDPINLYMMGARQYDPYINRFLSPDSIIPQPGNPQSLNRYTYALGNPLKYRDPSGHWIETAWDIANIGWDIYQVKQDPSVLNIGCLVVDVAAAALPFVPAGAGLIARGSKAAKLGIEAATHADEAVDVARVLSHADDMVDATKAVDEGVAAYRAYRGAGIHAASTGKAFSDWFKLNILKNAAATGKSIGSRTLDVVDETTKTIFELKNYTTQSRTGKAFWSQAESYMEYAAKEHYTLKYVFGQQLKDSVFQRLVDMGIEVWYIDDAGKMVRWAPGH